MCNLLHFISLDAAFMLLVKLPVHALNSDVFGEREGKLTVHQAGIGLLQLQNDVHHHLQEGVVPAVTLVMDEQTGSPVYALVLRTLSCIGLTCENVVVAVHLVELYALVENLQLLGCQHLAFPVGVTWSWT